MYTKLIMQLQRRCDGKGNCHRVRGTYYSVKGSKFITSRCVATYRIQNVLTSTNVVLPTCIVQRVMSNIQYMITHMRIMLIETSDCWITRIGDRCVDI